jgi:hypothetical protein
VVQYVVSVVQMKDVCVSVCFVYIALLSAVRMEEASCEARCVLSLVQMEEVCCAVCCILSFLSVVRFDPRVCLCACVLALMLSCVFTQRLVIQILFDELTFMSVPGDASRGQVANAEVELVEGGAKIRVTEKNKAS